MATVAEILSRQRTVVRQTLATDPGALQNVKTIRVIEGQLTKKVSGKLSRLTVDKGPKVLR
ncbi:MAG: hypothetical protein ABSB29_08125 [Nitrososphaerales archaeon]|jgi:predicted regulator of amino acid metabolism with ACT domain